MKKKAKSLLGIIEGFYGVFYTFPERNDLIRFAGRHGFNSYLYAPKNDRQHRARWWEEYPPEIMAQFSDTVQVAREAGIDFIYGISPTGSLCYSSKEDFSRLATKLGTFYCIGIRSFSLLLDDYDPELRHEADRRYDCPASAQADLANRLYAWLKRLDPACTLSLCPVDYSGRAPFSHALSVLGRELAPEIDVFYTGPEICSPTISANDVRQFTDVVFRRPIIWDNYPVNDLGMQSELHLAPLSGRSPDLLRASRGILANPMAQAEASKIPLITLAEYAAAPQNYDPSQAWERAIHEIAEDESAAALRVLAENCVQSCLGGGFLGETLSVLADEARVALVNGENQSCSPAIANLQSYLTEIDEATYHLKFRMKNLALRNNLLPWIEVLEHWLWLARFSFQVLRAVEEGRPYLNDLKRVHEYRELIESHPKRASGQSLLPLVDLILKRVEIDQRRRLSLEWQPAVSELLEESC